jgi:hypothetical protein
MTTVYMYDEVMTKKPKPSKRHLQISSMHTYIAPLKKIKRNKK